MNKKSILIVDDEPININIAAGILGELYQIRIATSGKIALEMIAKEKPNLILLDVMMPEMNGYEVAKYLTHTKNTADISFIFLTSKNDPQSIATGFNCGAVDYISKPFSKEELLARVFTHLKMDELQKSLADNVEILHSKMTELEKSKKEFETIFQYSKDGIAILDLESNFLKFNDAYLEMTGFTKEELLGKSCLELTAPEDRQKSLAALTSVREGIPLENFEKTCVVKNQQRIKTNMSVSLLPDEKSFLVVTKDVTSLKLREEELRLVSMGQMIGNIAHQWRQPLSIISTAASGAKLEHEFGILDEEKFKTEMDLIVQQTTYLSKTIDDFRNFIKGDTECTNISMKEVINETINLIDASLKSSFITLISDVQDDIVIYGNKNELIQALINILNNAKDSLKENIEQHSTRFILISTQKHNDEFLELKILDSGGGINSDAIERIFEPYFTTKHQLIGTGIGLTMAYKILHDRHKFNIRVYNEEFELNEQKYKGACFLIEIKTNKSTLNR